MTNVCATWKCYTYMRADSLNLGYVGTVAIESDV